MESKINKLSMRQILNEVGFPLMKNEFRSTYKFNVDINTAMQFEEDLTKIRSISDIEKIICEYEEIFDKELYIFHIARLLEEDIEIYKRSELLGVQNTDQLVFTNDATGKNKRRYFVNAKNLLKTCDVVDIVMKKKSRGEFEIYSSVDFIDEGIMNSNNRKSIAEDKLYKIEETIGLKKVLSYFKNTDLIEICKYPNLATILMVNQDKFEKNIKKYFQYMDIDKMLILSNAIYFYKYADSLNNISKEDAIKLKRYTLAVSKIVGDNVKQIKTTRFDTIVDFNDIKTKVINLVSDEEMLQSSLVEINEKQEDDVIEQEETVEEIETVEIVEEQLKVEVAENVETKETEEPETEESVEETEENTEEPEIVEIIEEQTEVDVAENIEVKETEESLEETEAEENTEEMIEEVIEPEENLQKELRKTEYIIKFINEENKTIVDINNIKQTIMKIDEDTRQETIEDGTNIFALPNKNCYIIQPLKKSFYGNATYVVEKDLYENKKEKIVNNNNINLNELEKLKLDNSNSIAKLVHTGWENSLETFFNVRKDEKYTKEEIENIEKIVYNVKK